MYKLNGEVTDKINFYEGVDVFELEKKYGTPLYIYNERILREKCKKLKNLVKYDNFSVNYSAKANSNIALLQIINDEGLDVDAMSPGEIFVELKAGFKPENIFYISNNVSKEEMQYVIDNNILISVDSISQLITYGEINPNSNICIRFNPGVGAGHNEKVITGGKNTKFGVNISDITLVKEVLNKYNLTLIGINQHIGSLFMDSTPYIDSLNQLESITKHFDTLEFIDMGGGFGIPYHKQTNESELDLKSLSIKLDEFMLDLSTKYGKKLKFKIEPGRYIAAECSVVLGKVQAIKNNETKNYVGTDVGFNVLQRPVMYDSYHEIEVYTNNKNRTKDNIIVDVVGNICETGDIIAKDRLLPKTEVGDLIAVLDAGAYGHVMSSNYNNRLRPAEVLIRPNGEVVLIRNRDSLEDLVRNQIMI